MATNPITGLNVVTGLAQQVAAIQPQVQSIQQTVANTQQSNDAVIAGINTSLGALQRDLGRAEADIENIEDDIDDLESSLATLALTPGTGGAPGAVGSQGPTGSQGIQGPQGPTGSQGLQGPTGSQGFQGLVGSQGFQGLVGSQGFQGLVGNQGFQGLAGSQGFQGLAGSQGFQGLVGGQGFQGPAGSQGFQGLAGSQGFQGLAGSQGFQGPTGSQGPQGPTGSTGATGRQGSTGSAGSTGATGPPIALLYPLAEASFTGTTNVSGTLQASQLKISASGTTGTVMFSVDATGSAYFAGAVTAGKILVNLTGSSGATGTAGYALYCDTIGNLIVAGTVSSASVVVGRTGATGLTGFALNVLGQTGSVSVDQGGNLTVSGEVSCARLTVAGTALSVTGPTGRVGGTGTQGATGATGIRGATGAQGVAGTAGAVGATGVDGLSSTGPTGPGGGAATFPMANASFTGAPVTCSGLIVEKGELWVKAPGSTGGFYGGSSMFVATREGDVSIAGPLRAHSTARVMGLLSADDGLAVLGASSFDGEVVIGTLGIDDGTDLFSPGVVQTNLINDGTIFLGGGYASQVYLGESFMAISADQVRVTAPVSIGTTALESSLVVAGNRAAFPSVASVSAGLHSGAYASLALTSGAGQGSWIDFMTAGATSMQARIQYSPSALNFQHILSGTERMRLTSTGLSIGTTTSESSLSVSGARLNYPTVAGMHGGVLSGTNASMSLCSGTGSSSIIDFQTVGQTVAQGRLQFLPSTNTFSFTSGASTPLTLVGANVGCGVTSPTSSLQVGGLIANSLGGGVNAGMLSASTSAAVLSVVAALSNTSSYVSFTYAGRTYSQGGLIQYAHTNNSMIFSTAGTAAMMLDNGGNLIVGSTTAQPTYKLYVNGAFHAASVSGTVKSFDIPHEGKGAGWRLRHRVLESPQGAVVYHFKLDCEAGENSLDLPEYYSWLAVDPIVHVTPYRCFGAGWGDVDAEGRTLTVTVNQAGSYRVTLFATRNDPGSVEEFDQFGVEYRQAT